jgi:hypothetical protein
MIRALELLDLLLEILLLLLGHRIIRSRRSFLPVLPAV